MNAPLPKLFLSYARDDDEAFVARLYRDLVRRGFDVWWDQVSLPSRRLYFTQEIDDAIRARNRLLYVAGPKALASEYVRQEWQLALACDLAVIPILRLGDYTLLPEELAKLHCEDLRDDARYAAQVEKLVANLARPEPPLGTLFGVERPSVSFVGRSELLCALVEALRADSRSPRRIGLYGMGGVGKSALAATLALDRNVRRAYPDGIVWVTLGARGELVQRMNELAAHFEPRPPFAGTAEGRAVLRRLTLHRALLVILDDAWNAGDVEAFGELGPRCRMLVTTRDAGVVRAIGAEMHAIEVLAARDALELFARETGQVASQLGEQARAIVGQCGGLPLAVSLCAALVKKGLTCCEVRQRLLQASLEKIADPQRTNESHRSLWRVMQVSVDALPVEARRRFVELAVFPTEPAVPECAVQIYWRQTGGIEMLDSSQLLVDLAERSLLRLPTHAAHHVAEPRVERHVRLHNLLHDYAERTAGDYSAMHELFVDAALAEQARAPHEFDGYAKARLPEHLVAAGDAARLLAVLSDPKLAYFHQWAEQGMVAEGIRCLEFLVTALRDGGRDDLVRVLATQLARLCNRAGDHPGVVRWLALVLDGPHGASGDRIEAVGLHERGSHALAQAEIGAARRDFRRALHIARRTEPILTGEVAANLIGLAICAYLGGGPSRPRARRTQRLGRLALECAEGEGDGPHQAEAHRVLADVHKDELEYSLAEDHVARGLALAESADLSAARASLLTAAAWMAYHRAALGDHPVDKAEQAFRCLFEHSAQSHDFIAEGNAWSGLGQVGVLRRDRALVEEAHRHLAELDPERVEPHLRARLGLLEADLALWDGDLKRAAERFRSVADASIGPGLWSRRIDALVGCGGALHHLGDADGARRAWEDARREAEERPRVRRVMVDHCIAAMQVDPMACPL